MRIAFRTSVFRRIAAIATAILITQTLAAPAFAAVQNDNVVTVTYAVDEKPVQDVKFHAYKVGSWSNHGDFAWLSPYDEYQLVFNDEDAEAATDLAVSLASYIARDNIEPELSAATDENGQVQFTQVDQGVYLFIGESYRVGSWRYTPVPTLVIIYGYNLTEVEIKHDTSYISSNNYVSRKVLKVWKGDTEETRPESVTMQLLRDGEVFDTVELTEENDWRYTWPKLEDKYDWTVVESSVPEDYTVSIDQEGITFVVTNTSAATPQDEPTEPDLTDIEDNETPKSDFLIDDTKLPQTGMLWWPVPILSGCGVILCAAGLISRKKEDKDDAAL